MNELTKVAEADSTEQRLLYDALEVLAETTDIQWTVVPREENGIPGYRGDAEVHLALDDRTYHYFAECKANVDRKAQIDQISLSLSQFGPRSMLVTEYLSKELAVHCRNVGLQFIDTHGNAYLRMPGIFVFSAGTKDEGRRLSAKTPKGLTNQAALRVTFALLSKPDLVSAAFKDIAALSKVALGTAYNVLADLERRGYLVSGAKSSRKLLEPQRLVEEWVANFPTALRAKLHSRHFSAPDPFWWQHASIADFNAVWGAEVAASKMFKHLKPSTQTLYADLEQMPDLIRTLVKQCRLRPDPSGPIEILEKFWSPAIESEPELAPPLVVYSDLLGLLDPRAKETAKLMKENVIASTSHPG